MSPGRISPAETHILKMAFFLGLRSGPQPFILSRLMRGPGRSGVRWLTCPVNAAVTAFPSAVPVLCRTTAKAPSSLLPRLRDGALQDDSRFPLSHAPPAPNCNARSPRRGDAKRLPRFPAPLRLGAFALKLLTKTFPPTQSPSHPSAVGLNHEPGNPRKEFSRLPALPVSLWVLFRFFAQRCRRIG